LLLFSSCFCIFITVERALPLPPQKVSCCPPSSTFAAPLHSTLQLFILHSGLFSTSTTPTPGPIIPCLPAQAAPPLGSALRFCTKPARLTTLVCIFMHINEPKPKALCMFCLLLPAPAASCPCCPLLALCMLCSLATSCWLSDALLRPIGRPFGQSSRSAPLRSTYALPAAFGCNCRRQHMLCKITHAHTKERMKQWQEWDAVQFESGQRGVHCTAEQRGVHCCAECSRCACCPCQPEGFRKGLGTAL